MTQAELIEVMDIYIAPLYYILGSICALVVIVGAILVVIKPWMRLR